MFTPPPPPPSISGDVIVYGRWLGTLKFHKPVVFYYADTVVVETAKEKLTFPKSSISYIKEIK